MKKILLLMLLAVVGGTSSMLAENFSPTADYTVRMNGSNDGYTWFKNSGEDFELKQSAKIFGLQTYTVTNLVAAKKITLVLKGESGKGTDASAIWVFFKNDWTTSTPASDMETAFATTTGVTHGATGTTSDTYLMINTTSNRSTTDGVQTCNFEITGDKLAKLKSVASGNTFTLLITNAISDVEGNTDTQRKYYPSSNSTEANRPYVVVEYDPVVLETNSTITTYSTLNDAFNGIADEGTGIITLYDNATITSRCNTNKKTINVVPAKAGITISSTLNNSIWILNNNSSGNLAIGSDDYQITIDGGSITNSSNHVESSGSSNTTINNVIFTNAISSHNFGIIANKGNGNLNLKNVTFNNCTANAGWGVVFAGSNNINIQENITFTGCTGYDFYLENKFVRIGSMTEPATPITVYYQTPALNAVILSSAGVYGDRSSWFKVMNDNFGLGYKSSNADHILTEAYTMTMNTYGASTLILPFEAKIPTGVTAYTLNYTAGNDAVKTTEVTGGTLAANTPVLINADADTKYWFTNTSIVDETTTGSGTHTSGALTGVYATTNVPAESYILWANATNPIGFYKANSSTVAANRAYLTADGAGVRALTIDFSGEETGINAIDNGQLTMDNAVYDLSGRRVSRPTKGLYIVNGRKVVLK